MNHHHMSEETQLYYPPQSLPNFPTNRFIYVKQNFLNPVPAPKVLVNPHFKKKVYVNPQFNPTQNLVSKPKIHINPNVLKSFANNNVPKVELKKENDAKSTVISTRNKLVRVPCNSPDKILRKRRNSLHTKYKIVRSTNVKSSSSSSSNKFKLDKRVENGVNTSLKSIRKKYVYVNRFLSINVMAKNVLLKKNSNLSKPGFVNINGILYKKSPNSLKKASDTSIIRSSKLSSSKYKIVRKELKPLETSTPKASSSRRSIIKRYKLMRSASIQSGKTRLLSCSRSKKQLLKVSPSKLRKCNIPCMVYRKFGKCKGKDNGTCIKLHNPNQIVLCTRFLQGACLNKNCLLSHKVSHEKMPTCKYFLDGLCSKDDCPYLHVKISPKADICKDFLEGFCQRAAECDKRHQFLCPDFEKNKTCPRKKCPYPHGNTVRKDKVLRKFAKKCSKEKMRKKVEKVVKEVVETHDRYYMDQDQNLVGQSESKQQGSERVIKTVAKDRPKLGDLPTFIPFFETT